MPLKTKENYLKTMYLIADDEGKISLSTLSKRMGVSTPTVNSMVKRLRDEGWVIYEKYKPLQLTASGKKEAGLIIRKHRIAEMFLVKKLDFSWEEVHDIAEEMEHIHSEALFDRMDDLLGNPITDPHGSPIPDKNGVMVSRNNLKLSEIGTGSKVKLCALLHSSNDFLVYLNSKKLGLGAEITVVRVEPFDQSMIVSYGRNTATTLSKKVCDQLLVEPVSG
ncbi:MAG: metal-dependent transcriptional regulator [Mangrovibacterium sp.]